ncbi:alpha/beta-hydrolase [Periconia macrospinosa]|uniref:Carboxypeptidase n=1 Tax=Periconia macrospinosa TaxID=97972 RepID=A0A2V1DGK1_9PLEO|nr:alpha/beta-hydrolase [Periconia macrospinosa]
MKFSSAITGLVLSASVALAIHPFHPKSVHNKVKPRVEKRVPGQDFQHPELQKRASRFLNDKTKEFAVNGTGLPDVPFDVGESYAGLLPISNSPNETRKLFFWFFPATAATNPDEIVIWLNGGPGCSSLSGLLTENGPFTWEAGTLAPVKNPYTWTNLTNMVWLEQPVGVGYSQGTPNITNEVELATELRGFWKNFIDTFGMKGFDMYITGESYAGVYIPYIADGFISTGDTEYFNLKGVSINDPIIGDEVAQEQVVILPFAEYWQNLFYLNDTYLEQLRTAQAQCGYDTYFEKYLQFPPPPGPFPVLPDPYATNNITCDQFDNVYAGALDVNPCFNIYHITETCPHPYSQLGIINQGDYKPPGAEVYFNRTDVQEALHAVVGTNWEQCSSKNVFGNGGDNGRDRSPKPATNGVLERVIEHTNNTIIGSGDLDMILCTNGTLLAIQNMTWNGVQGLQKPPSIPAYVPFHPEYNGGALAGSGIQGVWVQERGLTFYTGHLAGHELPGYTPGLAFRMLEILLGRIDNFSNKAGFTTQSGSSNGTKTL